MSSARRSPDAPPRRPGRRLAALPLLLVALTLTALAAVSVHDARPAEAQTAVWDTTLTVQTVSAITVGCQPCDGGQLAADEFSLGDTTYDVTGVQLQAATDGGRLGLSFGASMNDALRHATLYVGALTLPMADATLNSSATGSSAVWTNTGLTWAYNDQVRLRLTPGDPPPPARTSTVTVNVLDATLNVKLSNAVIGCRPSNGAANARCNNTAVLSASQFTHDGQSNTIQDITYHSHSGGSVSVWFTQGLPPDHVQDLTLVTEDAQGRTVTLALANAELRSIIVTNDSVRWSNLNTIPQPTQSNPNNQNPGLRNANLQWSGGEAVSFKLTAQAPPPPDDWQSWRPTLTVQQLGTNLGCNNTWSDATKHCSAQLTDDDFVFGGRTYTVAILSRSPDDGFTFSTATNMLPTAFRALTLRLGDVYLGGADLYAGTLATWSNAGLSWTAGQRVQVRLLPAPPGAPTDLALEPGGSGRITATWLAPQRGAYTAAVTGYELQYKWEDAPNKAAPGADPAFGWLPQRVGRTTQATLSRGLVDGLVYHVRVRALSASGPGPWNKPEYGAYVVGAPGPRLATRATPLRVLSVSHTSITEGQVTSAGDGTVTVTARLARPAAVDRTISFTPYGTATKITDYNWLDITIAAGERTGTGQVYVTNDAQVEGAEIIILRARSLPPEAYPSPGAAVYSLIDPRITILDNDTPAPADPGDTNTYHTDRAQPDDVADRGGAAIAEIARQQAACAASIKNEVNAWLNGTGTEQAARTAQSNSAACQF